MELMYLAGMADYIRRIKVNLEPPRTETDIHFYALRLPVLAHFASFESPDVPILSALAVSVPARRIE